MRDYKSIIAKGLVSLPVIVEAGLDFQGVFDLIEVPADSSNGDFSFPCFRLAKALKKAPAAIAEQIAVDDNLKIEYVSGISNAAAYVNFALDRGPVADDVVRTACTSGDSFGSNQIGAGRPVIVEFSSPNIAKPFHIGHIRSTVIGNSIAKIYKFLGYDTIRINHLGDYGTQFGKMIVAYRLWGNEEDVVNSPITTLLSYYTRFHEEAETDPSLEDQARDAFTNLEQGEEDETALWEWFREESLKEFFRVYKLLGIEFDSLAGESFYSDKMGSALEELKKDGLLKESNGAQIVDLSEYDMPPALITKNDGSTLYITRDIAAAIYRKETYDFYKNIYVVASSQSLHFQQLYKILDLMGYTWYKDCVHVPFGLVSLEDGTMSTRAGRVVFLEDVLNRAIDQTREIIIEKGVNTDNIDETARQVGIGAIVFNELSNNRIKDYVFSWTKVLNFEGETGPYVQYSYARAASVLRKVGLDPASGAGTGIDGGDVKIDTAYLTSDSAFELVRSIYDFPQVILEAGEKNEPSILTRHIIDIAQAFNKFYHEEHILTENVDEKNAKVALVAAAAITLKNGLSLLGMEAPERM
jgi:arginyl-tRNA synthetase